MSKASQAYGHRPMNTLSRGATDSRQPFNSGFASKGFGRQLDTAFSAGDNVRCSTLEYDQDSFLSNEPHAKRQKLEPQRNSQNTPQVLDGSEDEDQLMTEEIVSVRDVSYVPKDIRTVAILPNREDSKPPDRKVFLTTRVREYKNVENRMDSSVPKPRKRRSRQRNGTHDASNTPRSSFASSQSDSVEFLEVDHDHNPVVKIRYQGTANLHRRGHVQVSNGNSGRITGKRSPHFPPFNATKSMDAERLPSVIEAALPSTEPRLSDSFRDTNGKTRGGSGSVSSDELVTAVSNSRALSPVKVVRAQSPVKTSQSDPVVPLIDDEPQDPERPRSNIRPSTFTKATNNGTRAGSHTLQSDCPQEDTSPWSIALGAYNLQGKIQRHDSLGLVYNVNVKSFDIHHSGINLAESRPELRIQPAKLQKVFWADGGTKMRLQSSKTGNVDNVLDIEMCSPKDVQTLIAMLQESDHMTVKRESR